ncbi:VOC family protein [Kineococcus rhizosphaerae]|uniref:Catechol 2,3-dioxygenase-like lactoylglutathione lyase family enzyme n=1 Tax=Kineococcus rhizosphaerae TaxID=559628 RepID=A0A2T0R391_9ACTN|nr:VOC family protein [Kineococcus rhizosphaerae]PRY14505.1 catechol 2,3-dioxygenase-like lactoylglutathione lyase family enzyme [Kineococcus rhizosphaerae]
MHRSRPVTDVAHAGLTVPDLEDALAMWCDGLGFTLERSFTLDETVTRGTTGVQGSTIRAATVTLGAHRIELLQYSPPHPRTGASDPARTGAVHIALVVDDLEEVVGVCGRHGWRAVGSPHLMSTGSRAGTRITYLEGPRGGLIELIAPPSTRDETH